jgi:hypothetical protein
MRVASVFFVALVFGIVLAGVLGRRHTGDQAMVAKAQDRPALDTSTGEVARAQVSTE